MLKMGKMCHCKATIRAWDSTGGGLWAKKRGKVQGAGSDGTQADYGMAVDESGDLVYTIGTLVDGEDEGAVYRYDDLAAVSLTWKSDRNGLTELAGTFNSNYNRTRCVITDDGYLHKSGSTEIARYDPSTGDMLTVNTAPASAPADMCAGTSGDVYFRDNTTIRRYDSTLTQLNTSGGGNTSDFIRHGSSNYVWCSPSGIPTQITYTNASLTTLLTNTDARNRLCSDGTYIFAASASNFSRYSVGGTLARDWNNTTTQSTGSGYTFNGNNGLIAADGSSLYTVVEKAASVSKIQKRSIADGSITWEYDVGVSKFEEMRGLFVAGGVVAAIGQWYEGSSSTDPKSVVALNASDGSLLFKKSWGGTFSTTEGPFQVHVDSSGNVYVCGYIG